MDALAKHLRRQLENVVVTARETAETAARAALMHLGVGEADPPRHLTEPERALRRRLRAHGRQLGDHLRPDGRQEIDRLVQETAYEHWHRMLFARFLAENGLLMHPDGVAVSLAECSELAPDEGAANGWELAGRYASRMLPQIFRPDSPVLALSLAPEHQRALERLLADLPPETFQAGDSLGWVYQFWQTKKKDEVNASEVKIGADELPAVTQLFTEPYMVAFLLDNSLGAWWAAHRLSGQDLCEAETEDELRRKAAIPGVPLEFLRFVRAASDCVARASSPDQSGQDGLTTHGVARASSPGASGQDGLTTQMQMDEQTLIKTHGEHLPHWTCKGAVYHLVFRLADSVPQAKLDLWAVQRCLIDEQAQKSLDDEAEEALRQARLRHSEEVDAYLDTGYGACHLRKPEIAEIVAKALKHFDSDRYRLHAWCVMPNHVHVIVEPLGDNQPSAIVHSWKSFTANVINRHLGLSGAFWQADAYNHIIRTQEEYDFQVRYVWHNPEKANIPNWAWRWAADYAVIDPNCACVVRASSPDQSGQDGLITHPDCATRSSGPDQSGQDGLTTQWTPAAGTFDGWPEHLADLKVMDPCCGSGHFLVAALGMLVPMRMALEGLNAREAVDAVLRDNLHGLELDRRCVEIAAFALAFAAWRWPGAGGWRPLPTLNLACSGLGIHASKADWLRLGEGDPDLEHALERLYELFKDAPTLGSLIDPRRALGDDLLNEGWDRVAPLVARALASGNEEAKELGVVAQGLAHAAELLAERYHLVITNVPYLSRGKQGALLKRFCETHYFDARSDLANAFLERCLAFCLRPMVDRNSLLPLEGNLGVVQIVMPQNWLFLGSYRSQRERLLREVHWNLLSLLGPKGFQTPMWDFNVQLLTLANTQPRDGSEIRGFDVSCCRSVSLKAEFLRHGNLVAVGQAAQAQNPDSRVIFAETQGSGVLNEFVNSHQGLATGDLPRFGLCCWEVPDLLDDWVPWQGSIAKTEHYAGRTAILLWENGAGSLHAFNEAAKHVRKNTHLRGAHCIGKAGVLVTQMTRLPVCIYQGQRYDDNTSVLLPKDEKHLAAIWALCESSAYPVSVRQIDSSLKVPANTLAKVPFDLSHWQQVAGELYPHGLPKPYSNDPTQWIFHGHPCASVIWDEDSKWTAVGPKRIDDTVLQVAVGRLLGYRWPAEESCVVRASSPDRSVASSGCVARASSPDQSDNSSGQDGLTTQTQGDMELSDESRALVAEARKLDAFSDDDGIVCLPAIRGEPAADERLLRLLMAAYGDDWTAGTLGRLLAESGALGKSLDVWLRDHFFEQHCALFHQRPFIWHVWDGQKDGFAALVNYHKLDRANLERLIYTYLGDWLRAQERAAADGVQGADERLAAARALKAKLEAILEGEAPLDIFVRWKPIEQQPIGWEPDLNDGVRLNIRPFLLAGDVAKRGAGVLRAKPNVHWKKDRGKDVESAPWYHLFKGDRINDHHLPLSEKRAARRGA